MRKLLLLLASMLLAAPLLAQTGTLRGRVLDENGLGLPGASVYLPQIEKGVASNVNGEFILFNVPEGEHRLQISYLGYTMVEQPVEVIANQTVDLNFDMEPGTTMGETIVILGDRLKGQAKALNQQRNNQNITNVVAADQIGRFPDSNIGESLRRIPGITMQNDQGEARDIIIRGLAPQLNSVTLNGDRVPSAEGDNRNIQMDLIPADMIQTIEVNKAVTPDMDADAIGGSVNLVTRSTPSGLRISGTLASGANPIREQPTLLGNIVVGNRYFNNKLGVLLGASYNDQNYGSDNFEAEWDQDDNGNAFTQTVEIRRYDVRRVRRSFSGAFDYEFDANNRVTLNTIYNWRDDWENRFRLRIDDIESDGEGGYIGVLDRQTKGGRGTDRIDNRRLEDQRVFNTSLNGEHLLGGKLKLTWTGSYATAREYRPGERYITYASDEIPVSLDLRDTEFPVALSGSSDLVAPQNLTLDELTEETGNTRETNINGRVDLQIPLNAFAQDGFLKVGARYRFLDKIRDNNFFAYEPTGGNLGTMAGATTGDFSDPNYLAGSQYQVGRFATPEFLGSLDLNNSSLFERESDPSEFLTENYEATERITAGYVMWNQPLSEKFTVLAGVRLENTQIDYTGNEVLDEEELLREVSNTDSYTNLLPGLHLKFNASENLVIRAAWTNTLARPNFYDLVPFRSIVAEDRELQVGNPDLQPTTSMNLDLMVEQYFESVGLLSGGVFHKSVNDFIYTFVNENFTNDPAIPAGEEWTFFQPLNGGDATLYGFEVSVQRQLDFLPGVLSGLGIYANYTYTRSDAEGIRNEDGELREDGIALPGTAPHMLNTSLSFETRRLVVRASLNYADSYIDEVGGSGFSDRFYDHQTFVDVNGSYAITPKLRVFFEATNLTNQPLRFFQGVSSRTMQSEFYGRRFTAGAKFDLFK